MNAVEISRSESAGASERTEDHPGSFATGSRRAVFLTHSSFSSPFRVGSHQLTKVLDHAGWRVLHISTPLTPAHFPLGLLRAEYRARIRQSGRRFFPIYGQSCEYIPLAWVPWQMARLMGRRGPGVYAASQFSAAQRIRKAGFDRPEILFLDEPRLMAMARWFQPRLSVYRATDLYHEMKGDRSVLAAERAALREVDGFVATSSPVYNHLRHLAPDKPGLIVENGVEAELFSKPAPEPEEMRALPQRRAIYVGALDDRFDFESVHYLARHRPELAVVLIGPVSPKIVRRNWPSNLRFLGPRPYESIPAYLQHASVGLLPLTDQPANRGRSPMKIYEYGAAGLPVVASHTEELERRRLPFVLLYAGDQSRLPAIVDQAFAERRPLADAARATSQAMSWRGRTAEILRFCATLNGAATDAGRLKHTHGRH